MISRAYLEPMCPVSSHWAPNFGGPTPAQRAYCLLLQQLGSRGWNSVGEAEQLHLAPSCLPCPKWAKMGFLEVGDRDAILCPPTISRCRTKSTCLGEWESGGELGGPHRNALYWAPLLLEPALGIRFKPFHSSPTNQNLPLCH